MLYCRGVVWPITNVTKPQLCEMNFVITDGKGGGGGESCFNSVRRGDGGGGGSLLC